MSLANECPTSLEPEHTQGDTPPPSEIRATARHLTVPEFNSKLPPQTAVTVTTFGTVLQWTLGMRGSPRSNKT